MGLFPGGPKDRVLESQLDCRPCTLHGKKHCDRNHACMQSITPEQVMRALVNERIGGEGFLKKALPPPNLPLPIPKTLVFGKSNMAESLIFSPYFLK